MAIQTHSGSWFWTISALRGGIWLHPSFSQSLLMNSIHTTMMLPTPCFTVRVVWIYGPGTVDIKLYPCPISNYKSLSFFTHSLTYMGTLCLVIPTPKRAWKVSNPSHPTNSNCTQGWGRTIQEHVFTHTPPTVLWPAPVSQAACVGHRTYGQEKCSDETERDANVLRHTHTNYPHWTSYVRFSSVQQQSY